MAADDRRRRNSDSDAQVCPEEAKTEEKTLATADLVRESPLTRT